MPRKASEGHKRGLEIDYKAANNEDRPGFLRHIVYALHGPYYKGRFNILDEVANAAFETAPDKAELQNILYAIAQDLAARKEAAALLNKDNPPGVVAAEITKKYRASLGKTLPVRLPVTKEETMPREKPVEQTPLEPTPKAGPGLFGNKPTPEPTSDNIDDYIPRDDPPPTNEPAADKAGAVADAPEHVRNHILKHVAEHYGLHRDAKGQEAYELGKRIRAIFGTTLDQIVPKRIATIIDADITMDTFWSTHNEQEALDDAPKPEPTSTPEPAQPAAPEQPVRAVNMTTGEIIEAALVPYESQHAVERVQRSVTILQSLKKLVFVKGVHYGPQPGAPEGAPDVLKKPGAEMLASAHHYCPRFEVVSAVEQWDAAKPLFNFKYRCILVDIDSGKAIAEGIGSCNTLEKKYRWRWVQGHDLPAGLDKSALLTKSGVKSEFTFAIDKAETSGKYGKPAAYWQEFKTAIENGTARSIKRATANGKEYDACEIGSILYRIPNDEVFDLVNTVDKMAQKRALVAAVLIGCNASEFFTQDVEDDD